MKPSPPSTFRILLAALALASFSILRVSADAEKAGKAPSPEHATKDRVADFELSDQYQTNHTFKFARAKIVVFFVADQKGSDQISGWTKPLREHFGNRIDIDGVADVSSVPGPLRGLIRGKFKKKITYPVMLDWNGSVSLALGYPKNQVSIVAVHRDGRIFHRATGEATETGRRDLTAAIERALSQPATTGAPK